MGIICELDVRVGEMGKMLKNRSIRYIVKNLSKFDDDRNRMIIKIHHIVFWKNITTIS